VQQGFAKHIDFSKNQFRSIALGEVFLFSIWSLNWAESCFLLSHFASMMFVLISRASAVKLLPVIVELCNFLSGIGYFWICNQKVFSERCDFVFPFWWKARTRNFSIVAKSSCLSLKETMPFFHFIWRLLNTFRFFWQFVLQKCLQIDYKDSGVLETRHKFLRTATIFGRICRFEKVLPRMGRMSDPRHYYDLSKKSPRSTVLIILEMLECLQQKFTDCKHVKSTNL